MAEVKAGVVLEMVADGLEKVMEEVVAELMKANVAGMLLDEVLGVLANDEVD